MPDLMINFIQGVIISIVVMVLLYVFPEKIRVDIVLMTIASCVWLFGVPIKAPKDSDMIILKGKKNGS